MNITFSLDEELIGAAKALAARHGTSVTAIVRAALEQQVALEQQSVAPGATGVMRVLMDYSAGRVPRGVAMSELGLDDYAGLIHLLSIAGLPHPVVPLSTRKSMAQKMVQMLKEAGVERT